MALSNWDTLAIDNKDKPSSGIVISPAAVEIIFYKNWLYIHDPAGWVPASGYVSPTVGEIHQGELRYKDVSVMAIRGPQDGVYAAISHGWGDNLKGMVGCGVYGFAVEGRWTGVLPGSVKWFLRELQSEKWPEWVKGLTFKDAQRFNQGDIYFAERGVSTGPVTSPVGEAETPLMMRMIQDTAKREVTSPAGMNPQSTSGRKEGTSDDDDASGG